ncbi:MAG TPA: hypothetical protein ENH00_03495 [Actinobacteria bacterium]|nr:hypothetical protein [Actinomycetota bacterium]
MEDRYLFSGNSLRDYLDERLKQALVKCAYLPLDQVSGAQGALTQEEILEEFTIEPPQLREEKATLDHEDVKLDARYIPGRYVRDNSRAVLIDGTRFTFAVPIEGDARAFGMRPANRIWVSLPPAGGVMGQELRASFELPADTLDKEAIRGVKTQFDRWLQEVRDLAVLARADVEDYLGRLYAEVPVAFERRRAKLEKDEELAASLGVPLRRRQGAEAVPVRIERRRPVRTTHQPSSASTVREPAISDQDYEEVLAVITNLARTAERLPGTFRGLKEESIRDLILFYLNGTFEGRAGGELFNGEGRTDILVREHDRNVFVGECKIWAGAKSLLKAIDQLMGYLVWRDTKAALILVIHTKNTTATIDRACESIKTHPLLLRALASDDASVRSDYVFVNQHDPERMIRLALLPVIISPKPVAPDGPAPVGRAP